VRLEDFSNEEWAVRVAIIGTGVAGLVAAHTLRGAHDITVFEAADRVGGHVNTVEVEVGGRRHAVDTGFIVYNERNYPRFTTLLAELGVATQPTDMSFGVSDPARGLEYGASNLPSLLAQPRNLMRPSFLRLVTEIVRFNRAATALIADESPDHAGDRLPVPVSAPAREETLGEFVARGRHSPGFVRDFLVPFGASIWSADPETFLEYPARSYARFMRNHGLLQLAGRPAWRTITGGAQRYVEALTTPFADRIRLAAPVHKVVPQRQPGRPPEVEILSDAGVESFDRVVLASHSDQSLRLLGDATPAEREILGAIRYQPNAATLHTDPRMLPRAPRARASWNYLVDADASGATLTYWMNRLQSLDADRPLLVTLNRRDAIADEHVLAEIAYDHPVFDAGAIAAQRRRHEIQGARGVYFAGAYWGYGFHEDGVQSGLEVAEAIGRGA
jgi:predicted NAD/FAD-binding protein